MSIETVQLSNLAHLQLTGPDAERYLNGQVTQQVAEMRLDETRYTFVCDAKGRILFDAHITRTAEGFLLNTPLEKREEALARLDRYLIADDCEWQDVTEAWTLIHQYDSEHTPQADTLDRFGFSGRDRYYHVEDTERPAITIELERLEPIRITKGVPHTQDLVGAFSAETGLESRAVSFAKGCYLGQEVISRMKRAGRTNRQLRKATLEGSIDELPARFSLEASEKPLFTMTSLAPATESTRHALGYLATKYDFSAPLLHENGSQIRPEAIPTTESQS